jgi:hypothetical protein
VMVFAPAASAAWIAGIMSTPRYAPGQ